MTARIYRPSRTTTQSGIARAKLWVLEFEPAAPRQIDPLMGWTSSGDMTSQVRLNFATKEEAIAYAGKNGLSYRVEELKASAPENPKLFRQFQIDPSRPMDPLTQLFLSDLT